uniref:Coronatine-responsive tyrosine aminotransferase n=1 Tax=Capsella rubella TaxID=81985 RepID=B2WS94_9BRAS|nr:coronatine-responsive tyrosine aminotransferase [Capsella rubella]
MTVGCKQAIALAVYITASPNSNILLPKPGFPWDMVHAIYRNVEVREYEFLREKDYEIDFDSVRAAADKNTSAILIINPHNPNGNTYSEAHLKKLAELARELKILVIADEVFRWTVFGNNPHVPMAKFSSTVPVISLGSLSKGWSVPGWRTGWIALHDLDGVLKSHKITTALKQFLAIDSKPATVIQAAVPTILKDTPKAFFERRQSFLREKSDVAFAKLKGIPALTCYHKTEACTFLWTELNLSMFANIKSDEEFCEKLASEENLVLLPGFNPMSHYLSMIKNWARHSIDMSVPELEVAFDRLKSFCDRHSKAPLKGKAANGLKQAKP